MHVYSIGIEKRDLDLKDIILRKVMDKKPDGLKIEQKTLGDIIFLDCITENTRGKFNAERQKLQTEIADSISEIIVDNIQTKMVEDIIKEEYFYFSKEERDIILRDALAIMWGGNPTVRSEVIRSRWLNRIKRRIIEHLNENTELIFEGFVRFRLKDFFRDLEKSVDRAVDDLLIDKEYTEFIKLLRYFVEIQEPKVEEVHVMMEEDKKYTLLDSSLQVINNDILEDMAKEISEKEISYDDLLISSLITIAPNKITIHQGEKMKNTELLNTIKNVFCGKVVMSRDEISPKI